MKTETPQLPIGRDDPLLKSIEGITVIDVDTHLTEPGDLWTSRPPAKYKDLVPRVIYRDDEYLSKVLGWKPPDGPTPVWVVGDDIVLGYAGGASVINHDNVKIKGSDFIHWPLTEVSPAASFVAPRLAIMDEVGIWAQIVYPNAIGFGGQRFAQITDPELRLLCLTIWNDAMAEMQEESGGRIMGMGIIPWRATSAGRCLCQRQPDQPACQRHSSLGLPSAIYSALNRPTCRTPLLAEKPPWLTRARQLAESACGMVKRALANAQVTR